MFAEYDRALYDEPLTDEEAAYVTRALPGRRLESWEVPAEYHLSEDPSDEELGYPSRAGLIESTCRRWPILGPLLVLACFLLLVVLPGGYALGKALLWLITRLVR